MEWQPLLPYAGAIAAGLGVAWKLLTKTPIEGRDRWWNGLFDVIVSSYRLKKTERKLISSEAENAGLIKEIARQAATNERQAEVITNQAATIDQQAAEIRRWQALAQQAGLSGFNGSYFSGETSTTATPTTTKPDSAPPEKSESPTTRSLSIRSVRKKRVVSRPASGPTRNS